jgi:16S rRNA (guanine527-N7)-methyltransferase
VVSPGAVSRETNPVAGPDEQVRAALLARFPDAAAGLDRYAALLAGPAVERGLLGPRETPRIWARHLANSAVLEELVPVDARVVDVGSGAGLPGLPLALVRPDLVLVLLEPLLRRSSFLQQVVDELGLADRVEVRRGRAEDQAGPVGEVVTARAVAPLERLAGWALPLVPVGGVLLAVKGSAALDEATAAAAALARLGGAPPEVRRCGMGLVDPPTTVVRVVRAARPVHGRPRGGR